MLVRKTLRPVCKSEAAVGKADCDHRGQMCLPLQHAILRGCRVSMTGGAGSQKLLRHVWW